MTAFGSALDVVLGHEGGYVDHPHDRGGATNFGITQATYDAFRATHDFLPRPVSMIEPAEVRAIYHRRYWLAGHCDKLPTPVDLAHFDACVNHGLRRAAKDLQRVVGVGVDGIIGPVTLAGVRSMPPMRIVEQMLRLRLGLYRRLALRDSTQRSFVLGWLGRVLDLWTACERAA